MSEKQRSHHPLEGGSRITAYAFDPQELIMITDSKDPLYDKRVHDPISREFLLSIADLGVETPVLVRNRDGQSIITKGKQRNKGAIVVNALTAGVKYIGTIKVIHDAIKEFGADDAFVKQLTRFTKGRPLKIKAVSNNAGDDQRVRLAMRAENSQRRGDEIGERQRWAREEHEKYGTSFEDIARAEGVSVATIKRWTKDTKEARPKKKRGKASRPSRKQIETMYETHRDKLSMRERAIFDWVLGSVSDVGGLFPEAVARAQAHGHA